MNMANTENRDQNFDYGVSFERRSTKEKASRQRRFQYSRSNRPAVSHNGMHRRRNKRVSW